MSATLEPADYIITRKRKKYRFALFANNPLCFEGDEWPKNTIVDTLELGAGTGLFSVALAGERPDQQIVAVDVKADRLQKGASQAQGGRLTNVRFLRAHVEQLPELLPPQSIKAIWLTFPDPFTKKRAAKHRLTHPKFLAIYQQLLGPNGALYLKTDSIFLFEWSLEQMVAAGWHIQELSFDLHESTLSDSYKLKTTYEQRYLREGLKINFVKATRLG